MASDCGHVHTSPDFGRHPRQLAALVIEQLAFGKPARPDHDDPDLIAIAARPALTPAANPSLGQQSRLVCRQLRVHRPGLHTQTARQTRIWSGFLIHW